MNSDAYGTMEGSVIFDLQKSVIGSANNSMDLKAHNTTTPNNQYSQ
jgi:hypothetical protein